MKQVLIDNQDYADEMKEMLLSGEVFAVDNNNINTSEFSFGFVPEFKHLFDDTARFDNPLIYGKNTTMGIVAVEANELELEVFFASGATKTFGYKPWVLIDRKLDLKCSKLEGFLTYKYIRYFDSEKDKSQYFFMNNKKCKMFQVWNAREAALLLHGMTMFKGLKPSDCSILSFDIESMGLTHDKDSSVFIITNTFQKAGNRVRKHFREDHYNDVGEMIDAWCTWVREVNPDILVGHNIYGYDLPYLDFVAKKFGNSLSLGRDSSDIFFNRKSSEYRVDGNTTWSYNKAHIYGRSIIDTMFLSVKYDIGREFPSWGLKPIISHLGMQKEGRTFYDASKIRDNWKDLSEREKIVAYAIEDSDDALNLYELMIPAYFYMCQSLPIPFEEMMQGATGKWMNSIVVRSYIQEGHSIPEADEKHYVHGGISFGNPGLYKNVMKVDVTSLYPSCILTYNIYPENKDPRQNYLNMVRFFTDERIRNKKLFKQTKDNYYDGLQAAQKIAINSSYGMLGTNGLHFNDFTAANQVTLRGRAVLRKAILWASGKDVGDWFKDYEYAKDEGITNETLSVSNSHNFTIGPTDTDSISFCKRNMSVFSGDEQRDLLNELNSIMDPGISFEDDGYFSHILAVAAKNYCLIEHGSTKIKYKGSSIKDAKKEPALREFMDKCIYSLLHETKNIESIYHEYIKESRNITDIHRWAIKKSISKKLLEGTRKNETDVLAAIPDLAQVREGDKIFIYRAIDGERQIVLKGEPQFYKKTGLPKMEPNSYLKQTKFFSNDADTVHYFGRCYATLEIFAEVLDITQFVDYSKPKNVVTGLTLGTPLRNAVNETQV
jgi:DNA polymerase elongation subunit (family B)